MALSACGTAQSVEEAVDRTSEFEVERWVDGLQSPTGLAFLPDGAGLVIEKGGFDKHGEGRVLHITEDGSTTAILTLPVCSEFERGLVGLAVDPDFNSNRFVYLYRTMDPQGGCGTDLRPFAQKSGSTVNRLARFTWSGDVIDPESEVVLIDRISGLNPAHQGGGLAFGPDGYLYVGVGSGAQDDDTTTPSRNLARLEGKILRVSTDPENLVPADNPYVDHPSADPLVWASGFRNPFGLDVDPDTGTVMAGDVGRDDYEELNVVLPASDYGWPALEGLHPGPLGGTTKEAVEPVHVYDHSDGCIAVIPGGYLINDRMGTNTRGKFAFTDFACGKVWFLGLEDSKKVELVAQIPFGKSDLTVGKDGLVYVVGLDGPIWRVRPKSG